MTACSSEAGHAAGILKISLGSDEQPGSLFLRRIHQVGSASAAYTPKPRANLVVFRFQRLHGIDKRWAGDFLCCLGLSLVCLNRRNLSVEALKSILLSFRPARARPAVRRRGPLFRPPSLRPRPLHLHRDLGAASSRARARPTRPTRPSIRNIRPVTLPVGRDSLEIKPKRTGSASNGQTIGIVFVNFLVATAAGGQRP